jgi:substrate-binding family protein
LSISRLRSAWQAVVALAFVSLMYAAPAHAADPMKVGVSLSLTGGVASNGKQILLALELWRDDVNAKGGLLGRPVELVYYDDQSSPSNVPALYTKLTTVDKVNLLLGPYATNMVAPARNSTNERFGSRTAHGNGTTFSAVAPSERPVLPSIDPIFGSGKCPFKHLTLSVREKHL